MSAQRLSPRQHQAQLASVFDLDLWRSAQPGRDEHFDTARFGEWVELLVDAGASVAARTISAMDADLVVAGLSRYIRVFDPAALVPFIEGEPVEIEATPHRGPESEVGGYLVRGITAEAWDAIIALLLALESDHPDRFHAVMGECRRLSNSAPEVDGLDDLLKEPEQLLNDVALDRERRRSQQGYSTPADARAFLLVARRRNRPSNGEPPVNPLVAAYFRAFTDTIGPENDAAPNARRVLEPPSAPEGVPEALDAVVDLLAQSGLISQRPRALLEATHAQPSRFARLRSLMEFARESDDAMYVLRSHELAFLANTLVAGCSIQSRSFTPQEASDAAAGICNLGLEHWPALWPVSHAASKADLGVALPDTFLKDHDLVSAFEVGWGVLHENVSMFVAGQLLSSLGPAIQRRRHTERHERASERAHQTARGSHAVARARGPRRDGNARHARVGQRGRIAR